MSSSPKPLVGNGAVLIRVSSKRQDVIRQREGVSDWLRYRGLPVPEDFQDQEGAFLRLLKTLKVRLYEDKGPRDLSDHRPDFQRLLGDVEARELQWVVVQDIDRIGFFDETELGSFIVRFRRAGCRLFSAIDDDDITAYDDMTAFRNFMRGRLSPKEQWTKSESVHSKRISEAKRGQYTGGPIPYGFDVVHKVNGQEVWRYVAEERGKGVKILDGHEQRCGGVPPHAKGDPLFLSPSIRQERVEIVKSIFQWFATEQISYSGIASRLNDNGMCPIYGDLWNSAHIRRLISNPTYIGFPPKYRHSTARFYEKTKDGLGKVERAFGEKVKQRRNDPSSWVLPAEPVYEPLVSRELYDRCQERMNDRKRGDRAPRTSRLWLQGLVICAHCGEKMVGGQYREKRRGLPLSRSLATDAHLPLVWGKGILTVVRPTWSVPTSWRALFKSSSESADKPSRIGWTPPGTTGSRASTINSRRSGRKKSPSWTA
jgi:DNA invertase Pin-like site-specific DNA recombinase